MDRVQPPSSRPPLREKLGYYALGVAIGLMLLGVFWNARWRAAQAERARAEAQKAAAEAGGDPPPRSEGAAGPDAGR